jgi:hypothetical protein
VCHVESTTNETYVFESLRELGRFQVSARTDRESADDKTMSDAIPNLINFFMIILEELLFRYDALGLTKAP